MPLLFCPTVAQPTDRVTSTTPKMVQSVRNVVLADLVQRSNSSLPVSGYISSPWTIKDFGRRDVIANHVNGCFDAGCREENPASHDSRSMPACESVSMVDGSATPACFACSRISAWPMPVMPQSWWPMTLDFIGRRGSRWRPGWKPHDGAQVGRRQRASAILMIFASLLRRFMAFGKVPGEAGVHAGDDDDFFIRVTIGDERFVSL